MRSFFTVLAVLGVMGMAYLFAIPVEAHKVTNDNSMGVSIHVDPSDKPFAGEQTHISIELRDRTNEFDSTQCTCSLVVRYGDTIILTTSLFQNNKDPDVLSALTPITFPREGDYVMTVSGSPIAPAHFKGFSVDQSIRVLPTPYEVNATAAKSNNLNIILLFAVLCIVGIITILFLWRVYARKST